eukprot:TRINITY_DN49_c0_g4_i1.p1 TRINITY_DN49_c0_g4~~TRINITY_DN49_c0_g4_i1.p1  ORF type:complete len:729 (+),score=144.08 TRINITY_DN49_c0_g4_i1:86-2188(+)
MAANGRRGTAPTGPKGRAASPPPPLRCGSGPASSGLSSPAAAAAAHGPPGTFPYHTSTGVRYTRAAVLRLAAGPRGGSAARGGAAATPPRSPRKPQVPRQPVRRRRRSARRKRGAAARATPPAPPAAESPPPSPPSSGSGFSGSGPSTPGRPEVEAPAEADGVPTQALRGPAPEPRGGAGAQGGASAGPGRGPASPPEPARPRGAQGAAGGGAGGHQDPAAAAPPTHGSAAPDTGSRLPPDAAASPPPNPDRPAVRPAAGAVPPPPPANQAGVSGPRQAPPRDRQEPPAARPPPPRPTQQADGGGRPERGELGQPAQADRLLPPPRGAAQGPGNPPRPPPLSPPQSQQQQQQQRSSPSPRAPDTVPPPAEACLGCAAVAPARPLQRSACAERAPDAGPVPQQPAAGSPAAPSFGSVQSRAVSPPRPPCPSSTPDWQRPQQMHSAKATARGPYQRQPPALRDGASQSASAVPTPPESAAPSESTFADEKEVAAQALAALVWQQDRLLAVLQEAVGGAPPRRDSPVLASAVEQVERFGYGTPVDTLSLNSGSPPGSGGNSPRSSVLLRLLGHPAGESLPRLQATAAGQLWGPPPAAERPAGGVDTAGPPLGPGGRSRRSSAATGASSYVQEGEVYSSAFARLAAQQQEQLRDLRQRCSQQGVAVQASVLNLVAQSPLARAAAVQASELWELQGMAGKAPQPR